jgi:hypothetical protein
VTDTYNVNVNAAATQPSSAPIRKVVAATAGAPIGLLFADLVVGLTDDLIYRNGDVPDYLSAFILGVIPTAFTFLAGYFVPRAPGE